MSLRKKTREVTQSKLYAKAVVVSVMNDRANVRLSTNGSVLTGLKVTGGPIAEGQEVDVYKQDDNFVIQAYSPANPGSIQVISSGSGLTGAATPPGMGAVTAGAGLTGGGVPPTTLNVGAGTLIDIGVNDVGLAKGTAQWQLPLTGVDPFTPVYATAIANATATEGILKSDSSFKLSLGSLGLGIYPPTIPLHIQGTTGELFRMAYNSTNYAKMSITSAGQVTIATVSSTDAGNLQLIPEGDIQIDPLNLNMNPLYNYKTNLGSLQKKYLTIHAAELWVETLVAQNTIATIGGEILVAPTTTLTRDLETSTILNPSFETAGGGGEDVLASWNEFFGDGVIARDPAYSHEGSYSCKLTSGGSAVQTYLYQEIAVTKGTRLILGYAYMTDSLTYDGKYRVYDVTNSADIIAWTDAKDPGTIYTWTTDTVTIDVPATCETIRIYFGPNLVSGNQWFDNLSLYEIAIFVEHNEMTTNDRAILKAAGKLECLGITSTYTLMTEGDYRYYVNRNLDATGMNSWYAGDAVLNTGTTGDGFIDLYSISGIAGPGYGPTIVGNIRNSGTWNDWSPHWAIGNLDDLYFYTVPTYGVALGKYANSNPFITIDSTNGIRFWYRSGGADTQKAQWDASGNILIGEVASGKSNVYISSGGITFRTNTTPKIRLDADGDVFIGADLDYAASTNLAIFTNAQTYNSESMEAGDLLLGDNSSSKANLFWDKSAGILSLRSGTTKTIILSTSGNLVFSDSGSVSIYFGTEANNDRSAITVNGTGGMSINANNDRSYTSGYATLKANDNGTKSMSLQLGADAANGEYAILSALSSFTGFTIGTNAIPAYTLDVAGDARISSEVYIGETVNTDVTLGLTINQSTNDDQILALKASEVDHGMTTYAETDTYGYIMKHQATAGGMKIVGLSDADGNPNCALVLDGYLGEAAEGGTRSTSSLGIITMRGYVKSGTGLANPAADANILAIRAGTNTQFVFDSDGSAHANVEWITFDKHDDLTLLENLETALKDPVKGEFAKWADENRQRLQDLGLVSFNEDGHHFLNTTRMLMLLTGAVRQSAARISELENRVMALSSGV